MHDQTTDRFSWEPNEMFPEKEMLWLQRQKEMISRCTGKELKTCWHHLCLCFQGPVWTFGAARFSNNLLPVLEPDWKGGSIMEEVALEILETLGKEATKAAIKELVKKAVEYLSKKKQKEDE